VPLFSKWPAIWCLTIFAPLILQDFTLGFAVTAVQTVKVLVLGAVMV
jgi:hypothetical protein